MKPASKETKHGSIIGLLRSANGASVAELVGATGWQSHSVRGFLAGVVRKKLGLDLSSEKVDGTRRYFIGKK
ncbi:DUF3489 domain-containing protein [Variibacter gotjawalensis]|uniref:DUF3489 domain-containing protein n=1 Tax=Variibacter gotjawalensis TaxID=1333996 RepID=UPI001D9A9FA2|nr:DUF3489 domain-containing protein [Variibacter gotjawalensis]NIK48898.1 hypothetical protein [Variibacter gotjawalensis]